MSMSEEARISIAGNGGAVIITGGGSLTFMNGTEFGVLLKQACLDAESVIVDLRSANFIDTQIVQDLGRGAVTMLNRGKRLKVIITETAYPLRVLKISGYEGIMDVEVESM